MKGTNMPARSLNASSIGGHSPHFHFAGDDAHNLLVQGYTTPESGIDVPPEEDVVTVPALLAIDAAAALDPNGMNTADMFRMLEVFGSSAFHLETLSHYAVDTEESAFRTWQETGQLPDADDPAIASWIELVARHTQAGHSMRRVHVTHFPLSDYIRYELAVQETYSVPAGEQIRTVDADGAPDLAQCLDFWLFDDRIGVEMLHDDHGYLVDLHRMNTIEVNRARSIRDAAWNAASNLVSTGVR